MVTKLEVLALHNLEHGTTDTLQTLAVKLLTEHLTEFYHAYRVRQVLPEEVT